mmetsp:Transcript_21104/g.68041  ORF Transcript_21104/g.68041 Transcript_21104/m.68041 type:complete len:91 (+) Transcript_21104:699-971(+)
MIRTRLAVERALAEACVALDHAAGTNLESSRWRAWSAELLGSPVNNSPQGSRRHRLSQPAGALHWATPDTISKFGDDSDDDSAYFTDDGI